MWLTGTDSEAGSEGRTELWLQYSTGALVWISHTAGKNVLCKDIKELLHKRL